MDVTDSHAWLTAVEARALGCLIEKEATTPDVYPLTIAAVLSAANQKTAREPVMALETGVVNHALRQLEAKGLARQVFSSRAERYEHRTTQHFGLTSQQAALLGLLLLRGPQTAGELLSRSERLHAFADVEGVRHQLERMGKREPALVIQLPRGAGQREDRFAHLLCGPVDVDAIVVREPSGAGESTATGLAARVSALEADVAELREQIALLLDAAAGNTGT
ncbi:YceH family protein [Thermomonas carbonis]|uniref:DUF480 domain-containing protein n=1 Tax=Thermomonas carbonis TaxID=1463158 RepID=A0A7G9SPK5_9GAMM|nr:DUF480 domain-containing protein [Thermomonas carbonis]QNN69780.1 DUF480 domain-containing protein [Thermomonas carbonis]GHB95440.1 UPF0502 protein [Thermomonas carbonis]